MTLELALLRAARPQLDPSRAALAERLERLEGLMGGDAPAQPPASPPVEEGEITVTRTDEEGDSDAGPSANGIDLERMVGLWPAVLDQVRESGSELLSTVLAAARPVAVDAEDAVVKVGFPASAAFNKRKAEASDARDCFAEALKTVVGERLRPVYVLLEGELDVETEAPGLTEDELLAHVKSEFDAEEVAEDEQPEAGEEGA
jgi:hypothetical protein